MPFTIHRVRDKRTLTSAERSKISYDRRAAEGCERKNFTLPPDCVVKSRALQEEHGLTFTDLVVSLIRSA